MGWRATKSINGFAVQVKLNGVGGYENVNGGGGGYENSNSVGCY